MSTLHEASIGKTRKIAGYILSILPSLMILFAGIGKVSGMEEMAENMNKIPNIGPMISFIGILELSCLLLYWIPKTSNIGFFLLASYGGGIIVAEIVSGVPPFAGIMVTTLFYVGTMLRKPALSGLN